jgi:hypothetical protein
MKATEFRSSIRRILKEEMDKRTLMSTERVPEKKDNEVTPHKKETKTKLDLVDEMRKIVCDIDKNYVCGWDDHDDIMIKAGDIMKIRVIPRWEANYDIETFIRNEDRLYCTNQSWEQVKAFVKKNLKTDHKTGVESSEKKVEDNRKEKSDSADKGLGGGEKVKVKKVGDSSNKEKDFNQKEVSKKEDQPDQPMREVGDIKKLSDHKVKDPVKIRKKHNDDKHIVKLTQ